jgi:tRNA (guanine37-N1)-methyltransferase
MSSSQVLHENATQEFPNQGTQSLNLLTLFPEAVTPYFNIGVTGRAIDRKVIDLHCVNFRDYAEGNYKAVDDLPFGGGAGMVIQAEPVARALDDLVEKGRNLGTVIMMAPTGKVFTQADAERLS